MVLQFALTADHQVIQLGQRRVFMSHGHVYGPDHLPKWKKETSSSQATRIFPPQSKQKVFIF
jgi:hypothetical protein